MKRAGRIGTLVLAALLAPLALGCDKKDEVTRPSVSNPTLESLWPNQDGRTWIYRITARIWDDVGPRYFGSRDSVPPIPTLSQVAALLGTQPIGANPVSDTARFQLKFDGQITTASGVTAQYLKETILPATGAVTTFRGYGTSAMPGGFLRDLARARPDLAAKLASSEGRVFATADTLVGGTLFLFGYAWRRTSEWIGSYGDVDTLLAWKYLTKDLTPGSEFTHRLLPSLAFDIFLHGRILSRQTVETPIGTFTDIVVCLYIVDYGISEFTDENGNPAGFYRFYTYGSVAYAPGVGPVASYERHLVGLGNPSLGFFDQTLALLSSVPIPVPAGR